MIDSKPLFGQPCNNCGQCCREQLCPAAELMFNKEECVHPPCPALIPVKNKLLCGLVMGEKALFSKERHLISKALGIGLGCQMPDPDTTEEQIKEHDKKAALMSEGVICEAR